MTLEDVLLELTQYLGNEVTFIVGWDQIKYWPDGALEVFQDCGWIKPATPASMVECPGCEQNCYMPVHITPAQYGQSAKAYVACDQRNDMGRIPIPLKRLQQWQATHGQLAHMLCEALTDSQFSETEIHEAIPTLPLSRIFSIDKDQLRIDTDRLVAELAPPSPNGVQDSTNRFVLTGDHWTVKFGEKTATFRNSLGMRYLELLIRNQGKEVHVFDLCNTVNPPAREDTNQLLSEMSSDALKDIGLAVTGPNDAGETLDQKAIQDIKRHLEILTDRISDARETGDGESQAALEEEREQILQQLARDTGLGGKPRKTSSPIEQTRKNVRKCIRQAINKIEDSLPELGRHLNSIKTGTYCQYAPASKIEWYFDQI
jgi:hypothetical protein